MEMENGLKSKGSLMCQKDYISSPKRGNTKWWMTNSHSTLVPEHPIPGQIRNHTKYKTPPFVCPVTITTLLVSTSTL